MATILKPTKQSTLSDYMDAKDAKQIVEDVETKMKNYYDEKIEELRNIYDLKFNDMKK